MERRRVNEIEIRRFEHLGQFNGNLHIHDSELGNRNLLAIRTLINNETLSVSL